MQRNRGGAARKADAYELNGYDDWFLPSKDELEELYKQKNVVGGLTFGGYWSSSENLYEHVYAWAHDFQSGEQEEYAYKGERVGVRAIRAF